MQCLARGIISLSMQNIELVQTRVHWQVFIWTVLQLQGNTKVLMQPSKYFSGKMLRHWIWGVFNGIYFIV